MTAPADGRNASLPPELVRLLVEAANARGWDISRLAESAGLSPALVGSSAQPMTERDLVKLTQAVWRQTGDEMGGLGSDRLPRGSFRLLGYGLIGASDLGALISRYAVLRAATPALPVLRLMDTEGETRLVVTPPALSHGSRVDDATEAMVAAAALAGVHRFLGWAIGRDLPLHRVELPHSPTQIDLSQFIFGTAARYGTAQAALVFDASHLRAPIVRNEEDVESFVATAPSQLLRRPQAGSASVARARRILQRAVRNGDGDIPDAASVARSLSISPQTLRRHLASAGTSLNAMRAEILLDAALVALRDGTETIEQISGRLGFSQPSAFTRAFRRWTGSPPSAYRKAQTPHSPTGGTA